MKIIITSFALLYATSTASAHQGGLQAACDPTGLVSDYCKSGYYCEPIYGDPNQSGQCIKGGGLQAACDPADLGAGCQSGYYCEAVFGSNVQNGQCIPYADDSDDGSDEANGAVQFVKYLRTNRK